jgi:hypothetical protein
MCPEVTTPARDVLTVVFVAAVTSALLTLTLAVSFLATGSTFVPVIVTGVPGLAIPGENPVIVGKPFEVVTVNGELLVALPAGDVTLITPVVAPEGTVVTSCVAVADVTVAPILLNVTVF